MDNEQFLLKQLQQGSRKSFSLLFRKYYKDLVMFAGSYLSDQDESEDIVQNVFVTVWEKREELNYRTSFKSFLLTSVRNSCLDELRHRKVKDKHQQSFDLKNYNLNDSTDEYVMYSELKGQLDKALSKIPERERDVFEMSRLEGLKYKEIAKKLNISERTVEDRIAKTIKSLHLYLRDYLPFLVLFANIMTSMNVVL